MNTENDSEAFDRFARRFAGIEQSIPDHVPGAGAVALGHRAGWTWGVLAAVLPLIAVGSFVLLRSMPPVASDGAGSSSTTTSAPTMSAGPSTGEVVQLNPASPPQERTGPCRSHTTLLDRALTTVDQDARLSAAVFIGTILEAGDAQWNTPDGGPPARPDIDASHVLRLVRVRVDTLAKGTMSAVVVVAIPGGTIGCHSFQMGGVAVWRVAAQYAFFVNDTKARQPMIDALGTWQLWPISGGEVATPFQHQMPVDTFIDLASQGN